MSDVDPTTPKLFSDNMQIRLVWHTMRLLRIPNAIVMSLVNIHFLIAMFYQHFLCWLIPMRAVDVVCTVNKNEQQSTR